MQRRTPLIALLTLATTALLPLAAHADALDDILAKKQINIAVPTDFPPYGFVGTDLKPQGLDVDMAVYIGAKLGVKVELVPVTSANRIPYLQTKKADLVISTLGKNPEREDGVGGKADMAVRRGRALAERAPRLCARSVDTKDAEGCRA